MENNQDNAVFCFAMAYRWAKLYYNFKQKAMNEKLGIFQQNTTYKIYYNNLVSCLKGMSEANLKQVMEGVEDILNSRLDPEMVEICRYIKMAYVRMYEDEKTI